MIGNAQILTCPFCGKEKEIMSLLSGNTFDAELWSDTKSIAPMLPEISYVQKCPHCGKYYIMSRQKVKFSKEESTDMGILTFPEMKEAFEQFSKPQQSRHRGMLHRIKEFFKQPYIFGFKDSEEEAKVRMMLHQAYNDYYYRNNDNKTINEDDKALFHKNALWLINYTTDNVLRAELNREIGEFKTAQDILDSVVIDNDFIAEIVMSIRERIEMKDSIVFKINHK